jgi:serine/threonine protein kinase
LPLDRETIIANSYRVDKKLGPGARAYTVERLSDNRKFVIKQIDFIQGKDLDNSTSKKIFDKELEFMSSLEHECLPKIHGTITHEDKFYIIEDYVVGRTLEDIVEGTDTYVVMEKAIRWTVELSNIIDYIHKSFKEPMNYRELIPSNIIVAPNGKVKLVDFGTVKYAYDKNSDSHVYGTIGYTSPEKYKGQRVTNPQSDIYTLGVMLCNMITKYDPTVNPFEFPSLKSLNINITSSLESFVKRAVEIDATRRYKTLQEFRENLEKNISAPAPVAPPPKPEPEEDDEEDVAIIETAPEQKVDSITSTTETTVPAKVKPVKRKEPVFIVEEPVKKGWFSRGSIMWAIISTMLFGYPLYRLLDLLAPSKPLLIVGQVILVLLCLFVFNHIYFSSVLSTGCLFTIIFLGITIFLPRFLDFTPQAQYATCQRNLCVIGDAIKLYKKDFGVYPAKLEFVKEQNARNEFYIENIPTCPVCKSPYGYITSKKRDKYTMYCSKKATHVKAREVPKNGFWPQYGSVKGLLLQ